MSPSERKVGIFCFADSEDDATREEFHGLRNVEDGRPLCSGRTKQPIIQPERRPRGSGRRTTDGWRCRGANGKRNRPQLHGEPPGGARRETFFGILFPKRPPPPPRPAVARQQGALAVAFLRSIRCISMTRQAGAQGGGGAGRVRGRDNRVKTESSMRRCVQG